MLVRRKMILCIMSGSFFGRPFFFNSDFLPSIPRENQWFIALPYSFKYILYNNWSLRKSFFAKLQKYDKTNLRSSRYINNISFLVSFGLKFVYQKISFFFGNSFMFKSNWWEKTFIYSIFNLDLFQWWFRKGATLRKQTSASIFYPNLFHSRSFFLWDPLEDDYKNRNLKYHLRYSFSFINGFFYNNSYYKNFNFYGISNLGLNDFYFYKGSNNLMSALNYNLTFKNINFYV